MKIHVLQTKMNLLTQPGVLDVVTDLLGLFDLEHTGKEEGKEYYRLQFEKLKFKYNKEMESLLENHRKVNPQQIDLEESIKEIHEEKENN